MRVLIAEQAPAVRFALRVALGQQPGLSVCEVTNADELLSLVEKMRPDLVLLDWELPGIDIENGLRGLRAPCPRLFVIALSGKEEFRQAALAAGADEFVCKAEPPERLLAAIGECSNRERSSDRGGQK